MTTLAEATSKATDAGTNRKEKLKKAIQIGVGAVFGTVGLLLVTYWVTGAVNSNLEEASKKGSASVQTTGVRTSTCPGEVQSVELNSTWRTLNPGGRCRIIHQFPAGSVKFADSGGEFTADGWQDRNPDRARAAAGQIRNYYSLCPLATGGRRVNWDCSYL